MSLNSYVKHAERFGTTEVFETAISDLDVRELGWLSLRLQNLDSKWKVPDAGGFALRLLADGVAEKDVCRMAKMSRSTLYRLKREGEVHPAGAFKPICRASKTPEGSGAGLTMPRADLTQEAA